MSQAAISGHCKLQFHPRQLEITASVYCFYLSYMSVKTAICPSSRLPASRLGRSPLTPHLSSAYAYSRPWPRSLFSKSTRGKCGIWKMWKPTKLGYQPLSSAALARKACSSNPIYDTDPLSRPFSWPLLLPSS